MSLFHFLDVFVEVIHSNFFKSILKNEDDCKLKR